MMGSSVATAASYIPSCAKLLAFDIVYAKSIPAYAASYIPFCAKLLAFDIVSPVVFKPFYVSCLCRFLQTLLC